MGIEAEEIRGRSGQPVVSKQPQVARELEELHRAIERLGEALEQHTDRISRCLRPGERPQCVESAKEESLVPLAETIRTERRKVVMLTNVLQEMTDACEL